MESVPASAWRLVENYKSDEPLQFELKRSLQEAIEVKDFHGTAAELGQRSGTYQQTGVARTFCDDNDSSVE